MASEIIYLYARHLGWYDWSRHYRLDVASVYNDLYFNFNFFLDLEKLANGLQSFSDSMWDRGKKQYKELFRRKIETYSDNGKSNARASVQSDVVHDAITMEKYFRMECFYGISLVGIDSRNKQRK